MPTQSDRRVALVTGAGKATGLGVAVSAALARAGMRVVLTARRGSDAAARAADLAAAGFDVEGAELDVADAEAARALAATVERRFDRLHVLVNNAGGVEGYGEQPSTIAIDVVRRQLDLNLLGAWTMSQAFLPLLRRAAPGRLVHVGSGAGSHADRSFGLATGASTGPAYAVAKAALHALTATQAVEERGRVLVNAVCPGFTATFEGGAAMGARPVADGAASIVWAALLPADGPSGGLFRDGAPLGW